MFSIKLFINIFILNMMNFQNLEFTLNKFIDILILNKFILS